MYCNKNTTSCNEKENYICKCDVLEEFTRGGQSRKLLLLKIVGWMAPPELGFIPHWHLFKIVAKSCWTLKYKNQSLLLTRRIVENTTWQYIVSQIFISKPNTDIAELCQCNQDLHKNNISSILQWVQAPGPADVLFGAIFGSNPLPVGSISYRSTATNKQSLICEW